MTSTCCRCTHVLVSIRREVKTSDVFAAIRDRLVALGPEHGQRPVLLDLSTFSVLRSLILGDLVQIRTGIKGRRLTLGGLKPDVRKVFALTKLDKLFEIHESIEKAAAHLHAPR